MVDRVLVIVPALDEAPRIHKVLTGLRNLALEIDVVVVDDGSRDGTAAVARKYGADVLRHPFRLGYGAALQTGYLYAVRRSYRRCIQMDADGQHDPAFVPALLRALDNSPADVVIGSRALGGTQRPLARAVGSQILRMLGHVLAGLETTDPTSGFRALGPRALALLAEEGFPDDYPDVDVLIRLRYAGLEVREAQVPTWPRQSGRSMHRGWHPVYYAYKVGLAAWLAAIRGRRAGRGAP